MVLDFSQAPLLRINQTGMIEDIINTPLPALDFNISQYNTIAPPKFPAAQYLFNITLTSPLLLPAQQAEFHSTVAKILFISHRTRHDVLTAISFLTKRVLTPSTEDWHKLRRLILYLAATKSDSLILECTLPPRVQLYADSSFAVHHEYLIIKKEANTRSRCGIPVRVLSFGIAVAIEAQAMPSFFILTTVEAPKVRQIARMSNT